MTEQQTGIGALVGPCWSPTRVCSALDVTDPGLAARRESGEVLGLSTRDGDVVYPLWQFQRREGRVEVKPALVPLFRALRRFDGWAVAVLLHTPSPELDGQTPLGWLDGGRDPAAVGALGGVVAREWSAGTP